MKIKVMFGICLFVLGIGGLALSVPYIFGIKPPDMVAIIVGICDLATVPVLVYAAIKLYSEK